MCQLLPSVKVSNSCIINTNYISFDLSLSVTGINLHLVTPVVCIVCIFYTTLVSTSISLKLNAPLRCLKYYTCQWLMQEKYLKEISYHLSLKVDPQLLRVTKT